MTRMILPTATPRKAFTIVELLVVMAVIGLIAALLMPAVQSARESARRAQCQSNLRQLGQAMHNYEDQKGEFPTLFFPDQLLSFIDQPALASLIAEGKGEEAVKTVVSLYLCPSDTEPQRVGRSAANSYRGNYSSGYQAYGSNGFFDRDIRRREQDPLRSGRGLKAADITDGLSQTVAITEQLYNIADDNKHRMRNVWIPPRPMNAPNELDAFADFCETIPLDPISRGYRFIAPLDGRWTEEAYYNHTLPPNRPSCLSPGLVSLGIYTASSLHAGGVNSLFGDGHVQFISQDIDRGVWREMGSRAGGKNVSQ